MCFIFRVPQHRETTYNMHVTACLAGQEEVDVEVGEDCRTLQALKEAVVKALPQLCVEGFDVSVGGRALDNDEGVVSLVESTGHEVELLHVLRRFNKEADALANAGMDRPAEDAADFNIRPMPEDKAPS